MAVDVVKEVPTTETGASDGLAYSRHYADRIRDFGHASKSSWIERLNVVLNYGTSEDLKTDMGNGHSDSNADYHSQHGKGQGSSLPSLSQKSAPLVSNKNKPRFYGYASREQQLRPLPESLQNSPYNVPMVREHGTPRSFSADSPAVPKNRNKNEKKTDQPPTPKYTYIKNNSDSTNSEQTQKKLPLIQSNGQPGKSQDWKSSSYKPTPPKVRDAFGVQKPTIVITSRTERRAREIADSALKANKVFICEGPYPIDRFVRVGLRKRGWVEKFREGGSFPPFYVQTAKSIYDKYAHMTEDEEIEAVISESLPHPMLEDSGLHSVTARLVRHFPAKFIWSGTSINNLPIRCETLVNHFPKAKCFSSKTGLCVSLRELPWLASNTSMHFFPRCYVLNEDDKDDFVDDYRITACLGILKWVLKKYTLTGEESFPIRRENSQVEIIKEGEYIIRRHLNANKQRHQQQQQQQRQDSVMEENSNKEAETPTQDEGESASLVPEKTVMSSDSWKSKNVNCPGTPKQLSDLDDKDVVPELDASTTLDMDEACDEETVTNDNAAAEKEELPEHLSKSPKKKKVPTATLR